MELSDANKNIIIEDAKKAYPNECCGLIVDRDGELVAIPCKNVSGYPEKSFIVDPEQVRLIELDKIIASYHSHKDTMDFSIADIAFAERLQKFCVLYIVDSNQFKIYTPNHAQTPYAGRPFFIGYLDCLTLVQDYYKRELNIHIPDGVHSERKNSKTWRETAEKYKFNTIARDFFMEHGFVEVKDLKKHDLLLIKIDRLTFPSHLAIYLGNDQILQHLYEFSSIEAYRKCYQRLTAHIMRHRSLI